MSIDPARLREYLELAKEFSLGRLQVDGVDIYTTPSTFVTAAPVPAPPTLPLGTYDSLDDIMNDPDLFME